MYTSDDHRIYQLYAESSAYQKVQAAFLQIEIIDGKKIIEDDVDVSDCGLTRLPFEGVHVQGNFYCSGNELTTLEGAPQFVSGDFLCDGNELTTLEGAPQSVGGGFYCNNNKLTTLKGAPQSVEGSFSCSHNKLTTLEGAPQSVGGDFDCDDNQLTTLEGAPQSVGGVFYFSEPITIQQVADSHVQAKWFYTLDEDYDEYEVTDQVKKIRHDTKYRQAVDAELGEDNPFSGIEF